MKLLSVNVRGVKNRTDTTSPRPQFIIDEDGKFIEETVNNRRLRVNRNGKRLSIRDEQFTDTQVFGKDPSYPILDIGAVGLYDVYDDEMFGVVGMILNDHTTLNPKLYRHSKGSLKKRENVRHDYAIYIDMPTDIFIPIKYMMSDDTYIVETYRTKTSVGCLLSMRFEKDPMAAHFTCYGYGRGAEDQSFKPCGCEVKILFEGSKLDGTMSFYLTMSIITQLSVSDNKGLAREVKNRYHANGKRAIPPKISPEVMVTKYYCGFKEERDVAAKIITHILRRYGATLSWEYIQLPKRVAESGCDAGILDALTEFTRDRDHMRAVTIVDDDCYIRYAEAREARLNYILRLKDDGTVETIRSN